MRHGAEGGVGAAGGASREPTPNPITYNLAALRLSQAPRLDGHPPQQVVGSDGHRNHASLSHSDSAIVTVERRAGGTGSFTPPQPRHSGHHLPIPASAAAAAAAAAAQVAHISATSHTGAAAPPQPGHTNFSMTAGAAHPSLQREPWLSSGPMGPSLSYQQPPPPPPPSSAPALAAVHSSQARGSTAGPPGTLPQRHVDARAERTVAASMNAALPHPTAMHPAAVHPAAMHHAPSMQYGAAHAASLPPPAGQQLSASMAPPTGFGGPQPTNPPQWRPAPSRTAAGAEAPSQRPGGFVVPLPLSQSGGARRAPSHAGSEAAQAPPSLPFGAAAVSAPASSGLHGQQVQHRQQLAPPQRQSHNQHRPQQQPHPPLQQWQGPLGSSQRPGDPPSQPTPSLQHVVPSPTPPPATMAVEVQPPPTFTSPPPTFTSPPPTFTSPPPPFTSPHTTAAAANGGVALQSLVAAAPSHGVPVTPGAAPAQVAPVNSSPTGPGASVASANAAAVSLQAPQPSHTRPSFHDRGRLGPSYTGSGHRQPPLTSQQQQQQQQHQQQQHQQQHQYQQQRYSRPNFFRQSQPSRPQQTLVTHAVDPDPAVVRRFQGEYSQQDDVEHVGEDLREQLATRVGTVGTLDEDLCCSIIEAHDVTFVVTDTGTGKSTRIPMALHRAHPDALIVNAQPRRTAAINLARRVAEVLGVRLGDVVGYSVRGEHIGDLEETNIMYVTTYSLFIYFLWHELLEDLPFSYIIVDEFHERTPDVEVILLMLKLWLQKHPGAFKLVLCSATAQVEEWKSYFEGLTIGSYTRSPIMYPVREYFIEDVQGLMGIRTAPMQQVGGGNMVLPEQMHQLIFVCKQLLEFLAKNTATKDSVLVFMPGRTQVELMTMWIRENMEESLEPVAWYRDVELSYIQEALARSAVTRKKVYVATDIAEVSLTLPDVVFVIDSGTGKRPQVSEKEPISYAFPPLRLLWETKSNAQQRRGRVGRVQQGFYFSLLGNDHHTALRASENRIKNAVLTELVLHSLLITQKPFAFFQLCSEKPDRNALAYSLHLLQDGGLIVRADDPMADAERVALDRQRTMDVMSSPWNALIAEALTSAQAASAATAAPTPSLPPPTEAAPLPSAAAAPPAPSAELDIDEDDVASVNGADPEADAEAFQQCYFMTLRGVIAARSPVSVSAATNIFFGMLYGTPTLSMLAAAIEASRSPFYVPYTISDRTERAAMVHRVSKFMQRYHGALRSDLICSMEVILEYMSMQRDGLSEEAQEEWCQERHLSRTRVIDTLNLFAQMKEQVSSVMPFSNVTDIDVLTAQFNQNAELLLHMLVASHTELAIQVQLDGPMAQSKGFVGHGFFFPLKCLKDESVPTVCPWDRTKISVPLYLQTIQRKVLAVFASQLEPDLFALVLLVFSFRLHYSMQESGAASSCLMAVTRSGVRRVVRCDTLTAQQILQLRRIQCAQLLCMQLQVEERVKASESERFSEALRKANSDFGLPESAMATPYLIPTVLQHGLKQLLSRLKGSPLYATRGGIGTDVVPGTPYCKLVLDTPLPLPVRQSLLIHSNNGLSVVVPASASGAVAGTTASAASTATLAAGVAPTPISAAAAGIDMPPPPLAAADNKSDDDAGDDSSDSDRSSDSGAHVATFSYDA
ncbi:ATP-dependent RNA helicase-like protein [Novymonas esmeraldas]|uniref:ATP-dependent RNA helicase-like protein n=1 Tax=Novymonas esmeraldas TaxID=1808958 RepID=A0AAW0ESI2_9TRYP